MAKSVINRLKLLLWSMGYGGPVLSIAVGATGTFALYAVTHHYNWALLYAGIGASAWFAGLGGGLWATAASTVVLMTIANHLLSSPTLHGPDDISRIVTFIGTGSFISWLTAGRQLAIRTSRARAHQQETIAALSQQALSTGDAQRLVQDAVARVAKALSVDLVVVFELQADGQEMTALGGVGWRDGFVGQLRVGTEGLAAYALRTHAPVIVGNLRTETRFTVSHELQAHGVVSSVSVPIYREDRPRGAFDVHTRAARRFTPDDVRFLQSIANVLGMALDRERTERALTENRQRLSGLFEHTRDALLLVDDAGRLTDVNPTTTALTGRTREALLGRSAWSFMTAASLTQTGWPALLAGQPRACQCTVERLDGSKVDAELDVVANIVSGVHLVVVRDVRERKQAQVALETANQRLTSWVAQLERRTDEMRQLGELGDLLQSCRTLDEARAVIERSAARLFAQTSGGVYLLRNSQNLLEAVATWGTPVSESLFAPDDCWGLRRGRSYRMAGGADGIWCRHVPHTARASSLCVPMMARGEALGLLHVSVPAVTPAAESTEQLVHMVAESVALAVANLRLHESLQHQSIRDPLTGMFNRRYMEESLEREISRATRMAQPVAVVMLDLDNFKLFNDTHGHGAGDRLLQDLGRLLQRTCRGEDIACRYGGEEFALILPGLSLAHAETYANSVRERVAHLCIEYRLQWLGQVTMSAGVAVYPSHGRNAEALLAAADTALYHGKRTGRNRVCVVGDGAAPDRTVPRTDDADSEGSRTTPAYQTTGSGSKDR